MQKIKIGGVPEHFNYPWHQGIQNGFEHNTSLNKSHIVIMKLNSIVSIK